MPTWVNRVVENGMANSGICVVENGMANSRQRPETVTRTWRESGSADGGGGKRNTTRLLIMERLGFFCDDNHKCSCQIPHMLYYVFVNLVQTFCKHLQFFFRVRKKVMGSFQDIECHPKFSNVKTNTKIRIRLP